MHFTKPIYQDSPKHEETELNKKTVESINPQKPREIIIDAEYCDIIDEKLESGNFINTPCNPQTQETESMRTEERKSKMHAAILVICHDL
jgi:hypothetical protein